MSLLVRHFLVRTSLRPDQAIESLDGVGIIYIDEKPYSIRCSDNRFFYIETYESGIASRIRLSNGLSRALGRGLPFFAIVEVTTDRVGTVLDGSASVHSTALMMSVGFALFGIGILLMDVFLVITLPGAVHLTDSLWMLMSSLSTLGTGVGIYRANDNALKSSIEQLKQFIQARIDMTASEMRQQRAHI